MMWHYVWWCDTKSDDVTLSLMMWHYVWWCDTMSDDVTLSLMMWHYVWWCDTKSDDVTLCLMMWHFVTAKISSICVDGHSDMAKTLNPKLNPKPAKTPSMSRRAEGSHPRACRTARRRIWPSCRLDQCSGYQNSQSAPPPFSRTRDTEPLSAKSLA